MNKVRGLPKRLVAGIAVSAIAAAALVVVVEVGGDEDDTGSTTIQSTSREVGAPPLGPRESPVVASTGQELFVFGGKRPRAEASRRPPDRLQDGAIFEPERGWRKLPSAPLPKVAGVSAVAMERQVLVLGAPCEQEVSDDEMGTVRCVPGGAAGALYRPADNSWREIEFPNTWWATSEESFGMELVGSTGEEAFLHASRDGERELWSYEVGTSTWEQLPPPPEMSPLQKMCIDERGVAMVAPPDTSGSDDALNPESAAATPAILQASSFVDGAWTDVARFDAGPSTPLGVEVACGAGNAFVVGSLPSEIGLGRYDLAERRWIPLPPAPVPLIGPHVASIDETTVLVSSLAGTATLDVPSGTWTTVEERPAPGERSGRPFNVADKVVTVTSGDKGAKFSYLPKEALR